MRHGFQCVNATLCLFVWCGCSGSESVTPGTEGTPVESGTRPVVSTPDASRPAAGTTGQDGMPYNSDSSSQDGSTGGKRRHPFFPAAGPQQPEWAQADAPFDLVAYFRLPDSEENAERIYLDALFEFSPDMSVCFGSLESDSPRAVRMRTDTAKKRSERLQYFSTRWENAPSSVDLRAVDVWLAEYTLGFDKLVRAQQRSQCVFQVGYDMVALLPHLSAAREVARIVEWRTRRDVAQGNLNRPIGDVETLLRLSRDIRHRSGEIGQLVSVAIDRIVYDELVARILRSDGITSEHCRRLVSILKRHQTSVKQRVADVIRGQYVVTRQSFHDLQNRTGTFSTQTMNELFERDAAAVDSRFDMLSCLALLRDIGSFSSRLAESKYGKGAGVAGGQPVLPFEWKFDGKLMADAAYSQEVGVIDQVYTKILAGFDKALPSIPSIDAMQTWVAPLADTRLALLFAPQRWDRIVLMLQQSETQHRGTMCLVALRHWLCEHDVAPATLQAAVQSAGIDDVPRDSFTDSALKLTTVDAQTVIYSIGPDGQDDGGQVEWAGDTPSGKGDLSFRLHFRKPKSR